MLKQSRVSLGVKVVCVFLVVCVASMPMACDAPDDPDAALHAFLDDNSAPPEPLPQDAAMKGKADVIVLPTISVTVWAVGALVVYIGAQEVFNNTISDFEEVLGMAFGQQADWSWAESIDEPLNQADHLTESLNRIAYRSEASDFYSVNGNDYLRFLNMASPINYLDPKKLKDLMDGKVRPWGQYAKEYFKALQIASTQARHVSDEYSGSGLCARATVRSRSEPFEDYLGLARSNGPVDIIPAIVFASLKATIRCGMYDHHVRDYVYGYYEVGGPMDAIPDIFISHILKSAKLLYKYVDSCQMPPTIVVTLDDGDCHDATIH